MKKLLSLVAAAVMAGCNSDSPTQSAAMSPGAGDVHANATPVGTTDTRPVQLAGCYEMIFRRDTALLQLEVQDSTVTGKLVYNWSEKDHNTGTIKGVLRNNLIVADYHFESEGMMSTRELVLRVQDDDQLSQAFGDLTEENGKIIFTDQSNLQYDTIHPFIKVPCK